MEGVGVPKERTNLNPETEREETPIDIQAELHHLDEHIRSKIAAFQETGSEKQEQIEHAANALEAAKQRFYLLNQQQGPGADQNDPELLRLMDAARQGMRKIDMGDDGGGPPLA